MPENRNTANGLSFDNRGTVCIDTQRVLDCCRDRDCFENSRIYLSCFGEEVIANATSVRTRSAKTLWAFVGVDEVPFNNGFYQITVRYFVEVECEACLGIGRSQVFKGLAVLEKDVVLYGGEGRVASFSSDPRNNYCRIGNLDTVSHNDPVAIVESVDPIVLGTKIDCECPDCCALNDCNDIPDTIREMMDGELVLQSNNPHLYISFGIFSVIRIQRPAQLLVQATDYSVPDKECVAATNDDNPCNLFRNIAFPVGQFTGTGNGPAVQSSRGGGGGCGCSSRS
ncbi:MAG: hypothetical protein IJW83_03990 [Clostridia bacterium]|nr:hypothetical protein [Clostridia bacterium]